MFHGLQALGGQATFVNYFDRQYDYAQPGRAPAAAGRARDPVPLLNDHVVLTLWTNDPDTARSADAAGIDRIGVDLDRLGKAERQAGLATWISPHTVADLERLRPAVRAAAVRPHQPAARRVRRTRSSGARGRAPRC